MLRFTLLFTVLAFSAFAQVTPRNLLSGYFSFEAVGSALISKDNWKPYPKTPAEWEARLAKKEIDAIIKRGEKVLGDPIPPVTVTLFLEYVRNGNRSRYEAQTFARRSNLMDLMLAESVEDKGRFTDAIANYVWAICEETYWGVPAHVGTQRAKSGLPDVDDPTVDLFGAETVATLALADYFTGPKLDKVSPLIRKRIKTEADRKIFDAVKQPGRYNWIDPAKKVNNWNPWIVSNLMQAQLLLEPDNSKRSANLYQYMKWLDIYLNGLGDDGGCDEGPSYWFAAGGAVYDALETLKSATGGKVVIFNEPLIKNMASYIYKMHIADDYFVDFADADPQFSGNGLMIYRFGKDIGDETLSNFGRYLYSRHAEPSGERFFKPRRINDLLAIGELKTPSADYKPTKDAWFNDIQTMTARTASGLFLATHAGHNDESHNHNDVGDFIVYLGNEPVIIDVGRGNYTSKTFSSKRYELWFTQSQYHNLPIIDGQGQLAGRAYTAQNVRHNSLDTETSLFMDIAQAYSKEVGIHYWNRSVGLDLVKDVVNVDDEYELRQVPRSLQQVFMTVCDTDISQPGKVRLTTASGKVVLLEYDAAEWSATIDMPSTEGPEYSSFTSKWNNRPIKRILLTSLTNRAKNSFHYTIAPAK